MELALKGHRRLRFNHKLVLGWRKARLDPEKIVRANQVRQEREQCAFALWKSSLTSREITPRML